MSSKRRPGSARSLANAIRFPSGAQLGSWYSTPLAVGDPVDGPGTATRASARSAAKRTTWARRVVDKSGALDDLAVVRDEIEAICPHLISPVSAVDVVGFPVTRVDRIP